MTIHPQQGLGLKFQSFRIQGGQGPYRTREGLRTTISLDTHANSAGPTRVGQVSGAAGRCYEAGPYLRRIDLCIIQLEA
jgi:hypothetical protein